MKFLVSVKFPLFKTIPFPKSKDSSPHTSPISSTSMVLPNERSTVIILSHPTEFVSVTVPFGFDSSNKVLPTVIVSKPQNDSCIKLTEV